MRRGIVHNTNDYTETRGQVSVYVAQLDGVAISITARTWQYVTMGFLMYGGTQEFEFEDRTLAHIKVAITTKLRRQESFLMSWTNPPERGGGRMSIWLTPNVPLTFRFNGSRPPQLDKVWLTVLNELSNTPRGLVVISEDDAQKHARA